MARVAWTKQTRSTLRFDTAGATALHQSVSPDRWCVTHSDLDFLRQEVLEAIACGNIKPPEDGSDDFHSAAEQLEPYGPSIYTVNKQHIMPVTARAGKVSWALMMHPQGLECDLFISHAWQEGIFEFLSKVRYSWPASARHAWCCMLANPQNLDIGALLKSPGTSPFAIALRSSTHVLVVPNRCCSIYTRLWCAYEAYEAHEEGKIILIASTPKSDQISEALAWTFCAGLAGLVVGFTLKRWLHRREIAVAALCIMVVAASASSLLRDRTHRVALNRAGAFAGSLLVICWRTIHGQQDLPGVADLTPILRQHLVFLSAASFFCLMEVDRISGESRMQEALQLRNGFSGSISSATCSRAEDAKNIREAIGSRTEAVDYAIQVLLTAGMSTPTLREMARSGVNIEEAGFSEVALPLLFLVAFHILSILQLVLDIFFLQHAVFQYWLWPGIPVVIRTMVIIMLWRSPTDEQCFIFKMVAKVVSFYILGTCPLVVYWEMRGQAVSVQSTYTWFIVPAVAHVIIFSFTCLGMRGTRAIPYIGRFLLDLLLARGLRLCARAVRCGGLPNSDLVLAARHLKCPFSWTVIGLSWAMDHRGQQPVLGFRIRRLAKRW